MAEPTHRVHGIDFLRTGSCNRCGECCLAEQCVHYKPGGVSGNAPYQGFCEIYDKLGKFCEECNAKVEGGVPITHQVCADFPNHPWLWIIKDGICNYQFFRLDEDGNFSDEPLPFMDRD